MSWAARLVWGAWALLTAGLLGGALRLAHPVERALWGLSASGATALILLSLSLWASMLRGAPAGLRRALGLAAAASALAHAIFAVSTPMVVRWAHLLLEPQLRAGSAALVILLFLAATSFGRLFRRLGGRWWKPLHRGVYLATLLAVLHVWLSSRASDWAGLACLLGLGALGLRAARGVFKHGSLLLTRGRS